MFDMLEIVLASSRGDGIRFDITFKQALDLCQLGRVVELSKVFRLLRQVLSLNRRIALVSDDV